MSTYNTVIAEISKRFTLLVLFEYENRSKVARKSLFLDCSRSLEQYGQTYTQAKLNPGSESTEPWVGHLRDSGVVSMRHLPS